MRKMTLPAFAVILLAGSVYGGAPKDAPATLMLLPGKLLVSNDFKQPLGKEWVAGKGKWTTVDGALRGAELTSDMHGAVRRLPVSFDSAVIQFSFKLQGARATSLSVNALKGHICRVMITPVGFSVVKDADKKAKKPRVFLDGCKISLAPNEWHTMVVELHGKEMLARLDNKSVAFGMHDAIAVPKANLGFTVAGEAVAFKDFRVYEGSPLKTWPETKSKLRAERKK